jgi:hypothetical protein
LHLVFMYDHGHRDCFSLLFFYFLVWKGHVLLISRQVLDCVSPCHPLYIHATICLSTICFSVAAAFLSLLQNSTHLLDSEVISVGCQYGIKKIVSSLPSPSLVSKFDSEVGTDLIRLSIYL